MLLCAEGAAELHTGWQLLILLLVRKFYACGQYFFCQSLKSSGGSGPSLGASVLELFNITSLSGDSRSNLISGALSRGFLPHGSCLFLWLRTVLMSSLENSSLKFKGLCFFICSIRKVM